MCDLRIVAVFDEALFDHLFHDLVATNAEGELTSAVPLSPGFAATHPMQDAGAALLHLAHTHRPTLLSRG